MKKLDRKGYSWVVTLFVLLCLFSCAGNQDDSLDRIKKAGRIRIGVSPGYPPFSYYNAKHELTGFDVAVARELAKRLGVELTIVHASWKDIVEGLNARNYDAILASMAITDERQRVMDFSTPYYYARSQVMVRKGSSIKSLGELKARAVGAMGGSTFESDAKAQGIERIREYKTNDEALVALRKGEIEAVVTDEVVGMYARNRMGLEIEPLGEVLSNDKIAISVRKGDFSLLQKINSIVEGMRKDGTLGRLVEKMASD